MLHHEDPQDQDYDQPKLLLCNEQELNKYIKKLPRYRIDVISGEDLNHSIAKHKAERIQALFRKTKKKMKTHYNEGRWSQKEEDLYLQFIRQAKSSQAWAEKHTYRKRQNYFKEMSKFIKTRSPLQCRSHDQKMALKRPHIDFSSSESSEESELSDNEETPSEAKIEVKAESESHHTRETRHEISHHTLEIPRLNFDYPGLTKPDPCFNLVCKESLPMLRPIFPNPSLTRSFQGFNELEKKSMQVEEEEGVPGKDLEKIREEYFGMMRRMMRRKMLDVLSSCPMLEE